MDADEYLRVKDSAAYKAFHCEKNGTVNEYISDEVVDGERRTVTKTIPNIAIPWALRRAILGNRRVEFIDRRRWRDGAAAAPCARQLRVIAMSLRRMRHGALAKSGAGCSSRRVRNSNK